MSTTARVEPAQVRSNESPSAAESAGNALVTIDRASTADTELNTRLA